MTKSPTLATTLITNTVLENATNELPSIKCTQNLATPAKRVKLVSLFLVFMLLFTGCASDSPQGPEVVDEKATVMQGQLLGAATLGTIGGITGSFFGMTEYGVATGIFLGALLGGKYGRYVVKEKQRILDENKSIKALQADIEARNQHILNATIELDKQIGQLEREIARAKEKQLSVKEIKKSTKKEMAEIEKEIDVIKKQILTAETELGQYADKQTNNGKNIKALANDPKFNHMQNNLETNIKSFQEIETAYASMQKFS